jgi:hypothetical protein
MPHDEASSTALAFHEAVKTLPPAEQKQVAEAEADALRHGFSFIDYQKLRAYALKALGDPFVDSDF